MWAALTELCSETAPTEDQSLWVVHKGKRHDGLQKISS